MKMKSEDVAHLVGASLVWGITHPIICAFITGLFGVLLFFVVDLVVVVYEFIFFGGPRRQTDLWFDHNLPVVAQIGMAMGAVIGLIHAIYYVNEERKKIRDNKKPLRPIFPPFILSIFI